MSDLFKILKDDLAAHFQKMAEDNLYLYVVDLEGDLLWEFYLNSIPQKMNPVFRVRREYDCSACRNFIRQIGNAVAIRNGEIQSIWDFAPSDPAWESFVRTMGDYVRSFPVKDVFVSRFPKIGTDYNMEQCESGEVIRWDHLFVHLPDEYVLQNKMDTVDSVKAGYRDTRNVFRRALDEISLEAVDTVLELIAQDSLYRGDEYRFMVSEFRRHKAAYMDLSPEQKELYAWEQGLMTSSSVARIRSASIGTLLVDISANMDLEAAVRRYEHAVAPENYKRSKPIYNEKMLEEARQTITELGYFPSLQRRFAAADDITINNILFSNRDTAKRIQGAEDFFAAMAKEVKNSPRKFDRVEEIGIESFVEKVLPLAAEVEAYVESRHSNRFVSLIAPVFPDSKSMFRWKNNFSWAYTGNMADSRLKQNVKNAGGRVDGVLRFSIQWNDLNSWNMNDEDAHCIEPNGNEIFFGKKQSPKTGGQLDIDIINPQKGIPAVENIFWPEKEKMLPGTYRFFVNTYTARGGRGGFRAEIEFDGEIYSFDYRMDTRNKQNVQVAEVTLSPEGFFSIQEKLPSNLSSREIWGIHTNTFTPVSVICYSPNYWDEQAGIGNRHYFFMLKDCVNPEMPNGWYNEYLNDDLYPKHRKVMEALGSKAHVSENEDQLSGIGFSSTIRDSLIVKVKGNTERILRIRF